MSEIPLSSDPDDDDRTAKHIRADVETMVRAVTTDAVVWAGEFCRTFDGATILAGGHVRSAVDENTMTTWFANAIEIGRDAGRPGPDVAAEQLAREFHETYERLAPSHGYETRKASAVPWADVPVANRTLMVDVAGEILTRYAVSERG